MLDSLTFSILKIQAQAVNRPEFILHHVRLHVQYVIATLLLSLRAYYLDSLKGNNKLFDLA